MDGGLSDKILFDRLRKDGDRKAFSTLFLRYYDALVAYAWQFVGKYDGEGENVVQDVFLQLWEKRSEMSVITSVPGYLYTAVRNRCLNLIERGYVVDKYVSSLRLSLSDEVFCQGESDLHFLTSHLQEALCSLPDNQRIVFEFNRFYGKSYREIAAELNISEKTVEWRMSRALQRLRQLLRDYLPSIFFF